MTPGPLVCQGKLSDASESTNNSVVCAARDDGTRHLSPPSTNKTSFTRLANDCTQSPSDSPRECGANPEKFPRAKFRVNRVDPEPHRLHYPVTLNLDFILPCTYPKSVLPPLARCLYLLELLCNVVSLHYHYQKLDFGKYLALKLCSFIVAFFTVHLYITYSTNIEPKFPQSTWYFFHP